VLSAVLLTGISGIVFASLRLRSHSVLAPMGFHWATNSLGIVASALAWWWLRN
jgi:uncharacterized protein